MKFAFVLSVLLLATTNFASEVSFTETETVENYFIKLNPHEKATLEVTGETHFSCWNNFQYIKLEDKSDIVILRKPLAHLMAVVCDFPIKRTEGTKIELKNGTQFKKYYQLQVPSGHKVDIKPAIPLNRFCTAIFARMYNPETKECRSATNGCIMAELQEKGFEMDHQHCQ